MKRAVLALLLFSAAAALCAQDALWSRAVEMARRNKPWVPGASLVRIDMLNDKGESTESYETLLSISPDAAGDPVPSVVKASRNGADVTGDERAAQEKRNRDAAGKGAASFTTGDNPFDPDLQSTVQASPTGEYRDAGGKSCPVYRFTMKKKDGAVLEGTVVLDPVSGAPVEVRYTVKPLPPGVWSLITVLRYAEGPAGSGFLREISFEGTGGVLFIKRNFRSVITLDQYWKSAKG